jgi:hypothetical protein
LKSPGYAALETSFAEAVEGGGSEFDFDSVRDEKDFEAVESDFDGSLFESSFESGESFFIPSKYPESR